MRSSKFHVTLPALIFLLKYFAVQIKKKKLAPRLKYVLTDLFIECLLLWRAYYGYYDMIIRYENLLLSLSWLLWIRISDSSDVSFLWSLRGKSVTCMTVLTYQCRPYKSVTSNNLLLEALCSMFGGNNGESAWNKKVPHEIRPSEKLSRWKCSVSLFPQTAALTSLRKR